MYTYSSLALKLKEMPDAPAMMKFDRSVPERKPKRHPVRNTLGHVLLVMLIIAAMLIAGTMDYEAEVGPTETVQEGGVYDV